MNEVSAMAVTNTVATTTISPTAASEWAMSETTIDKRNQTTSSDVNGSAEKRDENHGPVGCYLVYESNSSGCLVLQYSEGPVPDNAVGFFCPGHGHTIQSFK